MSYSLDSTNPDEVCPTQVLLLALNFENNGVCGMIHHEKCEPLQVIMPWIDTPSVTVLRNDNTTSNINSTSSETHTIGYPICKGIGCSIYCINFVQCITKTFAINHIVLDDILVDCPFVNDDKTSDTMINKDKRFLLYWWFATNISMTCGRHNRIELPSCLIEHIRELYPNAEGEEYVGHKSSRDKHIAKKTKKRSDD